jgi:hypothetical protein
MVLLSKNLPPPPAPIEMTPEQTERKLRIEAQEAEKREKQRRLDDARKRLGRLSPELIEDVRLVCNAAVDEVVMRDYTGHQPFESLRRDTVGRAGACACSAYMLIKDRVK